MRFRNGVLFTPHGFPDWTLCARAVVELPPPEPGLRRNEVRVVDVLTANAAMAHTGDPLWTQSATPSGWCWAHLGLTRQVALVPIELHGCFRHAGGMRTLELLPGNGPRTEAPAVPIAPTPGEAVPGDVLDTLEQFLGWPLPERYREFLARCNGTGPDRPAVLAGLGLIADQPWFGVGRDDRQQDLSTVATAFGDRFTPEYLPIGYVQGGLLAVRVAGPDRDSIWYWDDDDPRDEDGFGADQICDQLLHRVADSIEELFASFADPPQMLLRFAGERVRNLVVREVRDEMIGAGLPARLQAPWQTPPEAGDDPLTAAFDLTS